MNPLIKNKLGNTSIEITQLGFGGGSLGDPFEITTDEQAEETIAVAYRDGMNYFDTAPWYGNTLSEHRTGHFLRKQDRSSYIINTKVGRVYHRPERPEEFHDSKWMKRWKGGLPFDLKFDYSYDGVMRSYEDSLQRLGLNTVDCLTIHDLDFRHQKDEEGVTTKLNELDQQGGFKALTQLKETQEIKAIGVGINHIGMIPRFLERFDIDFFLVAMPYTLMDQEALDEEFPLCEQHGASIIIGAVYCSGILAKGVAENPLYAYQPADQNVINRVKKMHEVCQNHKVPLGAAAIQFPMGHSVVTSVIPGPNSSQQVRQNKAWFETSIPQQFWDEMKTQQLIREDAPVPMP